MLDAQIPLPRALEFYNARLSKEDLRLRSNQLLRRSIAETTTTRRSLQPGDSIHLCRPGESGHHGQQFIRCAPSFGPPIED